jgi:Flp pilus assembly protein TadB
LPRNLPQARGRPRRALARVTTARMLGARLAKLPLRGALAKPQRLIIPRLGVVIIVIVVILIIVITTVTVVALIVVVGLLRLIREPALLP